MSTSSSASWPAASIAARMSGTRLVTPVEVSLWTTMTARIDGVVAARISSRPLGVGAVAPVARHPLDLEPEPLGHAAPQRREVAGLEREHAVAGGERVDERRLPRAGARGRVDDDGPVGLEDVPAALRAPRARAARSPGRDGRSSGRRSRAGRGRARSSARGSGGSAVRCGGSRVARVASLARSFVVAQPAGASRHVAIRTGEDIRAGCAGTRSAASSAAALTRELRGDVRADAYTRHLFAGDASMYAREPLAGRLPARRRRRRRGDRARRGASRCRWSRAAAAPASPGQTAGGDGIVLDTSRHMNGIRELDPRRSACASAPASCRRTSTAPRTRHGLGFGPDTSTSNRATIGGMIGNNSSGSQSIVHGTTIDHVLELDVVLSDGSRASFGPIDEAERERRAQADTLEGAIYRGLPEILRDHARAIAEDYPKHWRQSGGYRLDRLAESFDLARFVTGSEGTLVAITEATVAAGRRCPRRRCSPSATSTRWRARSPPPTTRSSSARHGRDDRPEDPRPVALEARVPRLAEHARGRPRGAAVRLLLRRHPRTRCAASSTSSRPPGRATATATTRCRAETAAEQDALTKVRKAGLGLLMAASEGARRPAAFVEDTAVAPERLNDYVARFREVLDRHGLTPASTATARSAACTSARSSTSATPGGVETMEAVAGEIVVAGGGVRRRELLRARRRPRAQRRSTRRVFGDDLYEAMRKVKRLFDPDGRLNPGIMVDAAPITVEPARPGAARPRAR